MVVSYSSVLEFEEALFFLAGQELESFMAFHVPTLVVEP
jgi:hypothetical protein